MLKILALYLFIQFVSVLPTLIGSLQMFIPLIKEDPWSRPTLVVLCFGTVIVLYLGAAFWLFRRAGRLSRHFVDSPEDQVFLSGDVSKDLLKLAFQCLGVYAIITWVPQLLQHLCRCAIYSSWEVDKDNQLPLLERFYNSWSILIAPTIGTVLGLLLIFRAKGLLRLIQLSRPMYREQTETIDRKPQQSSPCDSSPRADTSRGPQEK